MGTERRPFISQGLVSIWRALAPYAFAGTVMVAAAMLWQGQGLWATMVTSGIIFVVMMLPGLVGAGIGIVAVLLSRIKL